LGACCPMAPSDSVCTESGGGGRFDRAISGLAAILVACTGCSGPTKPDCLRPPCPLPIAIVVRVSSASGGPVPGLTLTLSGAASGSVQCNADAGTTSCVVPGPPGRYDLLFAAPGFAAKTVSVTVQGSTPACGCTSVERQDVVVVLTPG
jgi:hypothetical protein